MYPETQGKDIQPYERPCCVESSNPRSADIGHGRGLSFSDIETPPALEGQA